MRSILTTTLSDNILITTGGKSIETLQALSCHGLGDPQVAADSWAIIHNMGITNTEKYSMVMKVTEHFIHGSSQNAKIFVGMVGFV